MSNEKRQEMNMRLPAIINCAFLAFVLLFRRQQDKGGIHRELLLHIAYFGTSRYFLKSRVSMCIGHLTRSFLYF